MFTGIVTAIGTIESVEQRGDLRVRVACPWDPARIAIGASIACAGVCLTVVERGGAPGNAWFAVDVSAETISRTAHGMWREGAAINLEPSLKVGDEIDVRIVSGHVDAVGTVATWEPEGDSMRVTIVAPQSLAPFIAAKGSITVDGVSLTVNEVRDADDGTTHFSVNIIPHTAAHTTLGSIEAGNLLNLEIDVLARYLKRLNDVRV